MNGSILPTDQPAVARIYAVCARSCIFAYFVLCTYYGLLCVRHVATEIPGTYGIQVMHTIS